MNTIYNFGGPNNFYFCEGRLWNGNPFPKIAEFSNAITSLVLSLYGIVCLFYTRNIPLKTTSQYLYILLILCGLCSSVFHSSMSKGWQYMDELPMILMITFGVSEKILAVYHYKNIILSPIIKHGIKLIMMFYMLSVMVIDIIMEDPTFFRTFFGIPYIIISFILYDTYQNSGYAIRKIVINGAISGVIGLICWILDYHLCNQVTVYLYFHSLWHILIGYCSCCLFELLHYYKIKKETENIEVKYICYVIPIIDGKQKKI